MKKTKQTVFTDSSRRLVDMMSVNEEIDAIAAIYDVQEEFRINQRGLLHSLYGNSTTSMIYATMNFINKLDG